MNRRQMLTTSFSVLLMHFLFVGPALAHGTRVVPHVADGGPPNGIRYRTKFDITNLSPTLPISSVTVHFFRDVDGQPWMIDTNQGSASDINLFLGALQTIRIETLASSTSTATGFAIVDNLETTTDVPSDHDVAITVYYEVLQGNNVIDTVSVPVGQATVSFAFPVEIDQSKGLDTGFAIVNLTDGQNKITLQLYEATSPMSQNATAYPQTASLTLDTTAAKKTARFLDQAGFFPGLTKFKGMAYGSSQGPVALLALLQTSTSNGVQFATLVPAYPDSMRRNTILYLPQGYSLDADLPVVDYFRNEDDAYDSNYQVPWDLLYQTVGAGKRRLAPQPGAMLAPIGSTNPSDFDNISLVQLLDLGYATDSIDLSDNSPNLTADFAFAVKTGLGRYAKVRIRDIKPDSSGSAKDLVLEVYVYK
jgi:hypothetical protein